MFGFICGRGAKFWKVAGVDFFFFLAQLKLGHNIYLKKKKKKKPAPRGTVAPLDSIPN